MFFSPSGVVIQYELSPRNFALLGRRTQFYIEMDDREIAGTKCQEPIV